jgi:ubiquinol-cytochrome c reductase cytochrome c subunit
VTRVLAALALILVSAACVYVETETAPSRVTLDAAEEQVTNGHELYQRDCAWCHGNRGDGTARGPDLTSGQNGPAFTSFMLTSGRMPISDPDERVERGDPVYNDEQIDAIVDYVASFGGGGPDIPEVDLEQVELGEGLELYFENCAACHAPTLVGAPLTRAREGSTPSPIAPGPGAMPVFTEETFSKDQVDSIVAYVVDQQDPDDRGGADIGRIGPVSEGAVAWIIGMGAMLLLIRWIGTKVGDQ